MFRKARRPTQVATYYVVVPWPQQWDQLSVTNLLAKLAQIFGEFFVNCDKHLRYFVFQIWSHWAEVKKCLNHKSELTRIFCASPKILTEEVFRWNRKYDVRNSVGDRLDFRVVHSRNFVGIQKNRHSWNLIFDSEIWLSEDQRPSKMGWP